MTTHSLFKTETGSEHFFLLESRPGLVFPEAMEEMFDRYRAEVAAAGLGADSEVRLRFYLSDISNQFGPLEQFLGAKETENCFFSAIGQAPASGSKVGMEAYHTNCDAGIEKSWTTDTAYEIAHGAYRTVLVRSAAPAGESANDQVGGLFSLLETDLKRADAAVNPDLIRTWIYVRDIDSNYQNLADVRKAYFESIGLTAETNYVASTGIEGNTEKASRLYAMDSIALKGLRPEQVYFLKAPDNICPTHAYRTERSYGVVGRNVTFERGTQITFGDRSHYYISGTASIDKEGSILYPRDVVRQAERMLENIDALLKDGSSSLSDLRYLIVYLRDVSDYRVVFEYLQDRLPAHVPFLMVRGSVCNPSWLVEAEGVAVNGNGDPAFPTFH